MLRKFYVLSLFIFAVGTVSVKSQDCLEKIYKANQLLDNGKADECLNLIAPCLGEDVPSSVRWQAFRLKALSNLLLMRSDSARIAAENMLEVFPEYTPDPRIDTREFMQLLEQIIVIPKFSLGLAISAGANATFPQITETYITSDYSKKYKNGSSLQFGTCFGLTLSPHWVIESGFISAARKYVVTYSVNNWDYEIKEKLSYIEIPLKARYIPVTKQRVRLFVEGGVFGGFLAYGYQDFHAKNLSISTELELEELNILEKRKKFNTGLILGTGAIYSLKKGNYFIQANYNHSMINVVKNENRYLYPEQIYSYYFLDDDLKLHNLSITLGASYFLGYRIYKGAQGSHKGQKK